MDKNILGIAGKPGAGKDTFCDFFESLHDSVEVFKFSDPLSEILLKFFDEVKREDQQWLVNNLRERFGEDILAKAIKKKIKKSEADFILLNGVRVWDDFELVKELEGKLVYIQADPKTRWKRMKERGEKKDDDVSFEKFLQLDQGKTEKEIAAIGKEADYKIDNNNSKEDLKRQVSNIIEKEI